MVTPKISRQRRLEPETHRRAAEQIPTAAQQPPNVPRRFLGERPLPDPEGVERHAVGMQQPRHVVIRRHEQRRWVGERLIVEQYLGIDVAMRRDHRQVAHGVVDPPCDGALAGLRGQQPVRMQCQRRVGNAHALMMDLFTRRGNQRRAMSPAPYGLTPTWERR